MQQNNVGHETKKVKFILPKSIPQQRKQDGKKSINSGMLAKTIMFDDGSIYIGQYNQQNEPDGFGSFSYPDNTQYIGQCKNGKWDGYGLIIDSTRNIYIGKCSEGKLQKPYAHCLQRNITGLTTIDNDNNNQDTNPPEYTINTIKTDVNSPEVQIINTNDNTTLFSFSINKDNIKIHDTQLNNVANIKTDETKISWQKSDQQNQCSANISKRPLTRYHTIEISDSSEKKEITDPFGKQFQSDIQPTPVTNFFSIPNQIVITKNENTDVLNLGTARMIFFLNQAKEKKFNGYLPFLINTNAYYGVVWFTMNNGVITSVKSAGLYHDQEFLPALNSTIKDAMLFTGDTTNITPNHFPISYESSSGQTALNPHDGRCGDVALFAIELLKHNIEPTPENFYKLFGYDRKNDDLRDHMILYAMRNVMTRCVEINNNTDLSTISLREHMPKCQEAIRKIVQRTYPAELNSEALDTLGTIDKEEKDRIDTLYSLGNPLDIEKLKRHLCRFIRKPNATQQFSTSQESLSNLINMMNQARESIFKYYSNDQNKDTCCYIIDDAIKYINELPFLNDSITVTDDVKNNFDTEIHNICCKRQSAQTHQEQPPQFSQQKTTEPNKKRIRTLHQTYKNGDFYEGGLNNGVPHGKGKKTYENGDVYEGEFKYGLFQQGQGKKTYANRDFYKGEFSNGLPNGQGEMKYNNGNFYKGEFKYGFLNGKGEMKYENGDFEKGEFNNGSFQQGQSKKTYENGYVYEGQFQDGVPNGQGEMRYENGDFYKGEFQDGSFQQGQGKKTYENGYVYEGQFQDGVPNGQGEMRYNNGDFYKGEFQDGSFQQGQGKKTYENGYVYEGQFQDGAPNGQGEMRYENGDFEKGEFQDGSFQQGQGKKTYENGYVYEGEFSNSLPHGQGEVKYNNGNFYKGEFQDGSFQQGQGKKIYANGDFYKGQFSNSLPHGQGEMKYNNRDFYKGEFKYGYLNGKGEMKYNNGNFYEGEFQDDVPCGQGKKIYANGDVYEGQFNNGLFQQGQGKKIYANGDVYEGQFNNGSPNGQGKYILNDINIECELEDSKLKAIRGINAAPVAINIDTVNSIQERIQDRVTVNQNELKKFIVNQLTQVAQNILHRDLKEFATLTENISGDPCKLTYTVARGKTAEVDRILRKYGISNILHRNDLFKRNTLQIDKTEIHNQILKSTKTKLSQGIIENVIDDQTMMRLDFLGSMQNMLKPFVTQVNPKTGNIASYEINVGKTTKVREILNAYLDKTQADRCLTINNHWYRRDTFDIPKDLLTKEMELKHDFSKLATLKVNKRVTVDGKLKNNADVIKFKKLLNRDNLQTNVGCCSIQYIVDRKDAIKAQQAKFATKYKSLHKPENIQQLNQQNME